MRRKARIGEILLLCSLALFSLKALAADKIKVTATVDRNQVEVGNPFILVISVSSSSSVSVGDPVLPPFSGLDLFHSWNESSTRSTFSSGQGGFQTVMTQKFNYQLAPKKVGKLRINPIQVVVDGKNFRTQPIIISSLPRGKGPKAKRPLARSRNSNDPFERMEDLFNNLLQRPFGQQPVDRDDVGDQRAPGEDFFIVVEVDKQEAFVGEQITASWYLYTRGQVLDLDTLKYPSLKGFWKEDIEIATHLNFRQAILNGVAYRKALLASYALFPIKEGSATVDAYKAKATIIGGGRSAFSFSRKKSSVHTSKPIEVTVKALPKEEQPNYFTGGVGQFQVKAEVTDKSVVSGQPFEYNLRFDGKGLSQRIDSPELKLPPGVKVYDKKSNSRFFKTGRSYKEFKYLLIAENPGDLTLPAVQASTFHPETGMYEELATEEIPIVVLPGATGPALPSQSLAGSESESKEVEEDPFPPLIGEYNATSGLGRDAHVVLWSTVFFSLCLALFFKTKSEFGWGVRKKNILQSVQRRFQRIRGEIDKGNTQQVGILVTNGVYFVLGELSGQGGAHVELEKLLLKAPPSVRRDLEKPVLKLMESFQAMGFAPEQTLGELKEKDAQKKLVIQMEKTLIDAVKVGIEEQTNLG